MTYCTTSIRAISPVTKELTTYCGPHVPGFTKKLAREYCDTHGLGYCHIGEQLISEIDADKNNSAMWDTRIDYDNNNN